MKVLAFATQNATCSNTLGTSLEDRCSYQLMLPHHLRHFVFAIFFIATHALSTGVAAQSGSKTVVSTERVRAELMAYAPDGVEPGKPLWVGLQLAHQPSWHTYWKNAGDSGLPTVLQWQLPTGVSAGDIAWPMPQKIRIGTLANYGYEGTVLLPVPLTIGPDFKPGLLGGDLEVKLKASWLVCQKQCIPEDGEFAIRLPIKSSTALNASLFEAAFQAQPRAVGASSMAAPAVGAAAAAPRNAALPPSTARIEGAALQLSLQGLPAALRGKTLQLFAETPEVIETAAAYPQAWQGALWTASVPLSGQRSNSPSSMPFVLVADAPPAAALGQASPPGGWRVEAQVLGTWPQLTALTAPLTAPASPGGVQTPATGLGGVQAPPDGLVGNATANVPQNAQMQAPSAPPDTSLSGLLLALAGALLGGLILNLMPCVFPVLAIKVLGFAQHAPKRHAARIDALAYTLGVVLSFVALGALMLALRAGGEALGWGFQLQSPAVVAGLALLFTLLGLNLAGLFELGQMLPSGLASLQAKNPAVNALLSGVLAVAIASPCTAPFMGASLGLALALPALQALLLFAAVGLGMALPYLAASLLPAVARLLPRPGAWMNTLRRFMAFPMFATVAWLVWVLGQQSGIDGAGALLALLVAVSSVVWALGLQGRTRAVIATILIAVNAVLAGAIGHTITKISEAPSSPAAPGARWQAWEPGRVEQVLAQGQPVFVDFTAAWCVTCQYNKKTTLADAALLAEMDGKKVAFLRADWTRRDSAITAALGQLGRNGVPVYVLYAPGKAPQVLSEVLSVDAVRAAVHSL